MKVTISGFCRDDRAGYTPISEKYYGDTTVEAPSICEAIKKSRIRTDVLETMAKYRQDVPGIVEFQLKVQVHLPAAIDE